MNKLKFLAKCLIVSVSGTAVLTFSIKSEAITIGIDPGNIGDPACNSGCNYDLQPDIPLNGNELILDFQFNNMKHVEVESIPGLPGTGFSVIGELSLNGVLLNDLFLSGDIFLSDENGNDLGVPAESASVGVIGFSGENSLEFSGTFTGFGSVIFHDIHYSFTLPNIANLAITEGQLQFEGFNIPGNPTEVGEWEKVPESSSVISLLAFTVLGIGFKHKLGKVKNK